MDHYLAFFSGVVCAALGGEFFVRGAVGLAHWARVSPGIIGATVAAFATSSPELSVSISSALAEKPQITLGDCLGSNVVNVALILAIALTISPIRSPRDSVSRDFPVALGVPVVTGVLVLDGVLSRVDGLILLSLFIAWMVAVVIEAHKQRSAAEQVLGEGVGWLAVVFCLAGLALLAVAGSLIVSSARSIALVLGIDEFIIGATIVALGTSVPELATTLMAKLRGHDEIGLGTILGSNIFNGLFVIAVAAVIYPITVAWREVAVSLGFGLIAVLLTLPGRQGFIGRSRGVLLLLLYGFHQVTLIQG